MLSRSWTDQNVKVFFKLKLFSPFVVFMSFFIFGLRFLVFGDFGFHLCRCVFPCVSVCVDKAESLQSRKWPYRDVLGHSSALN